MSEHAFQTAHQILKTKSSEHSVLCEVALKLEVSPDSRTRLMQDHQKLGLCFGLSEALAELSSRVEMMAPDADDFQSLSCALGLKAVEQAVRHTSRQTKVFDCLLQDINSIEDTYLALAKAVVTPKSASHKETLAAVFGVMAVLASALGAASKEGAYGADTCNTALKCSPKVPSIFLIQ